LRHVRRFCFPWVRCFHSPKVAGLGIAAAGSAVSIPQRCDWKAGRRDGLDRLLEVISIPQRCDWKHRACRLLELLVEISIPQRCDWKRPGADVAPIDRRNFNTSKVRLEGPYGAFHAGFGLDFNTSKVRLEGACGLQRQGSEKRFQYLKGAIGSHLYPAVILTAGQFQYLKGAIGSVPNPQLNQPVHDFNTSKVRLEASERRCRSTGTYPFNTSKVRLEAGRLHLQHAARDVFQYLKGAIGSFVVVVVPERRVLISIPQRCDWKSWRYTIASAFLCISIPQRCDWKPSDRRSPGWRAHFNTSKVRLEGPLGILANRELRRISIPQRCDWKQK